jgi:hypothetical protein
MICFLAENKIEASRFAYGQFMDDKEWCFPTNPEAVKSFMFEHVIVLPGFANLPFQYREKLFQLAMNRKRVLSCRTTG